LDMQLSDTTNKNGLLQQCEEYTNLGDGTITSDTTLKKKFIIRINNAQDDVFMEALDAQDGWDPDDPRYTDRKKFTVSMTKNRDYTFAVNENILEWERVDVSYDGSEFYRAQPIDTTELGFGVGGGALDDRFNQSDPRYDVRGNQLLLFPKGDQDAVDAGGELRLEWARAPKEFALDGTDDSEEPFVPRPFHNDVAVRASYDWAKIKKSENGSLLSRLEADIKESKRRIENYYSSRNNDREMVVGSAITSSSSGHME
jgi:hypothetical protein